MSFLWEEWAEDLRLYASNAKQGIDQATDHAETLRRYVLYVQRLSSMLARLPGSGDAFAPLQDLRDELDLLLHRHSSDLLRPAAAARSTATFADKRLRAYAVACIRLFRQAGAGEKQSRERVAQMIKDRGYTGARGKFGASELKNWVVMVDTGDLPGADMIDNLFRSIPALSEASTLADATSLASEVLDRIRFPATSGTRAKQDRPLA